MTETKSQPIRHKLICDGKPLAKGERMERPWHCTCGAQFHGYDSAVKKDHREHRAQG